jgi:hypothetical protein
MYFLINALIKRESLMNFIDKILKIDITLKRLFSISIDYDIYRKSSLISLIFVLIYYNIISSLLIYFTRRILTFDGYIYFLTYVIQAGLSGVFTHGFVAYVILIYQRIFKLNENLKNITKSPPEVLEIIYQSKNELCMELMRYTKMYKQLCSCVEDLNQIYGFCLVLQFSHDFTLLTSQIFGMFYVGFFVDDVDESRRKIFGLILWMIPNMLKITFICFICHVTKNEVCESF